MLENYIVKKRNSLKRQLLEAENAIACLKRICLENASD
jgi:hypothetical protein